jgi:hypothetical protein
MISGGIYAYNYYVQNESYYPTTTLCTASNCYTIGYSLGSDGIFGQTGLTNTKANCFSELTDSIDKITIWKDSNAMKTLIGYRNIWIKPNICACNNPWLLLSYNTTLYSPNKEITKCKKSYSVNGSLLPSYYIISVNNRAQSCNIKINNLTGKLNFKNIKRGKYLIMVLNGTPFQYALSCNYYTFINYNINYFGFISKYNPRD